MDSLSLFFTILQRCGLLNFAQCDSVRKNRLQRVYVFFQTYALVVYNIFQSFNVLTRGTRYFPEFVQTFFDTFMITFLLFILFYIGRIHRKKRFLKDWFNSLTNVDNAVMVNCHRRAKLFLIVFMTVVGFSMVGNYLEPLIPVSEGELEIRRRVYRTKFPERRLPFNLRIPYLDESQSWTYEAIYGYQVYALTPFIAFVGCLASVIPMNMICVRGHYEILCKYIRMVGYDLMNERGRRIFYTSIQQNEYVVLDSPIVRGSRQNRIMIKREMERRRKLYEENFVRQIIRYHQMLLVFQNELTIILQPIIFSFVLASTVFYILLLYILVASSTQLSLFRYFKFVAEFIGVLVALFIICNSSEVSDDCSGMVCTAINTSGWERTSPRTRRSLIMLLRRTQKSNHWQFHGAVVLSKVLFLKVVKLAYTFVNCMRCATAFVDSR